MNSNVSFSGKFLACVKLTRPTTSLLAAFGSFVGSVITLGSLPAAAFIAPVLLAFLTVFLQNAGGYVINDYFDLPADRKNHPERPLVSAKIKPRTALSLACIFFAASIVVASMINQACLVISGFTAFLLLFYERIGKKILLGGNISIAFLTGLTFIFGALAVGMPTSAYFLAILAFFAIFAREITKDIADVKGDTFKQTLPAKIGVARAAIVSGVLYLIAIALSPLPYFYKLLGVNYLAIVALADLFFLYVIFTQTTHAKTGTKVAKAGMFIALLAFLFGSLTI